MTTPTVSASPLAFFGPCENHAVIAVQRDLKRTFDPKELLNPGKIFPTGHRGC